ncbi:MAG: hypothetical protein JXA30_07465 [Deltaproteobacteria bacterium]|nr:hypothetical protein [Deltaproteobacteria bacterium]
MKNTMTLRFLMFAGVLTAIATAPNTSLAVGYYKFCARWQYQFTDQGLGEDYLKHTAGQSYGRIAAARSYAMVWRDSTAVWGGYMNSSGCTGSIVGNAGTYLFWIFPEVSSSSNKKISIYPDSNEQWYTWSYSQYRPAVPSGSTVTLWYNLGGDPISSVAAVATEIINRAVSDTNFLPDKSTPYKIYANQMCPGGASACYTGGRVYLGTLNGGRAANIKTAIAHEMGHANMDYLMGIPKVDYNHSVPADLTHCRCDHVSPPEENRLHCLQSREHAYTSQAEGWAHFYAADLFNNPSDSNCWFAYYKEFLYGVVAPPPVQINAYADHKWIRTLCSYSSTGSELDWLTLYWKVNNKTASAFSFADLNNVYRKICGDAKCDSNDVPIWNSTLIAVGLIYGTTHPKFIFWRDTGVAKGTDL